MRSISEGQTVNVQFFDRQDSRGPHNGELVTDPHTLFAWLAETRGRPPFFLELLADNGYKLLVGVSDTLGCAQYSARDGSPPYMMVTEGDMESKDKYMVFLTANTDTPVPLQFCLPMATIREAMSDFIATGQMSTRVAWEEL